MPGLSWLWVPRDEQTWTTALEERWRGGSRLMSQQLQDGQGAPRQGGAGAPGPASIQGSGCLSQRKERPCQASDVEGGRVHRKALLVEEPAFAKVWQRDGMWG